MGLTTLGPSRSGKKIEILRRHIVDSFDSVRRERPDSPGTPVGPNGRATSCATDFVESDKLNRQGYRGGTFRRGT